jgi:ankyrin repeat protein
MRNIDIKKTLIILLVFIAALIFASPPAKPVYNLRRIEALKGRAVEKIFLKACKRGDIDTVRLIIKSKHKNVVFTARDKNMYTGLMITLLYKHFDIARLLVHMCKKYQLYINKSGDSSDSLQIACYLAGLELVKMLIKKGALINSIRGGNTPLMSTAIFSRIDIAKYLLSKGAYINARNNLGYTVLYIAMEFSKSCEYIIFLIKAGADPNIQTNFGDTVLHHIAKFGPNNIKNEKLKLKILVELLKHGAR